jgi:hypothetical protein
MTESCLKETTAKKLDGIKKGKIVASSDGRKIETINPTGTMGLP